MAEPCRIRAAGRADVAAVRAVEEESFGDPWPEGAFLAYLDDCFLVADAQGAVVGFLVARVVADEAEILDLAVAREHRRHGVGAALLRAALELLARRGVARTYLEVRASNEPALRLYASLGFRAIGRRRGYYQKPREDALVLARAGTGRGA